MESRTPPIGVSYSSLLKQSSKFVSYISIQTQPPSSLNDLPVALLSSSVNKQTKKTLNVYSSCNTLNTAMLKLLPKSSAPIRIENCDPAIHNYSIVVQL